MVLDILCKNIIMFFTFTENINRLILASSITYIRKVRHWGDRFAYCSCVYIL